MIESVNYISHHRNVYFKMSEDNRLTPYHLSVYNALFMLWNECGYAIELSINRNDVMMLSKIGNANTYTKCLKDLNEFGYIVYKPSFNPLIGSKVTIIRCDKATDKGSDKGSVKGGSKASDKSTDMPSDKGGDTLYKQLNIETNKQENNETVIIIENEFSQPQKVKTFKQWSLEDFQEEIKLNRGVATDKQLWAFFNYWSEINEKNKMRFQLQKTWETAKRISTWLGNESAFKPREDAKTKQANVFQDFINEKLENFKNKSNGQ